MKIKIIQDNQTIDMNQSDSETSCLSIIAGLTVLGFIYAFFISLIFTYWFGFPLGYWRAYAISVLLMMMTH